MKKRIKPIGEMLKKIVAPSRKWEFKGGAGPRDTKVHVYKSFKNKSEGGNRNYRGSKSVK